MRTLDLVRRLARIPSVTADRPRVNACSDFVARYLRARGLRVRVGRCGGYRVVAASTPDSTRCEILLNVHVDVVPAAPRLFRPRLRGERLFGRGVLDCKGHAAVVMNLLARLPRTAPVGALFTADEEAGGATARYMVRRGWWGRLTIVLDGNRDRVVVAQKGILSVRLSARGRSCHAATPWRGKNAIDLLLDGYRRVRRLFPRVSPPRTWRDTMAATIVAGGSVPNQVPDRAEMILNIRFTGKTDPRRMLRRLRRVSGLSVEPLAVTPFVGISKDDPLIRLFFRSMRRRYNPAIRWGRMNGATDARHFLGPGRAVAVTGLRGGGAHADGEWLDVRSLGRLEAALYRFITEDWPRAVRPLWDRRRTPAGGPFGGSRAGVVRV